MPFLLVDTGGWLPRRQRPRRQGQPPGRGGRRRGRRRAVRRRRHRRRHRRGRAGGRAGCAGSSTPVLARRQQGRQRPPRGRHAGSSWRSASATRTRSARCTAGAPATCSTRWSRAPDAAVDRRAERRARTPTLEDARAVEAGDRRRRGGDRRPAQRRQVDAVQPAGRRGPLRRARHAGHDPRRDRHAGRDRRTGRSCSSTPPACAARPRSTTAPSTTRWCGPCGRSTTPTSPCS